MTQNEDHQEYGLSKVRSEKRIKEKKNPFTIQI